MVCLALNQNVCVGQKKKLNSFSAHFFKKQTNKLSKLLTSCLTAVKIHVIKYCEKVYEV